MRYRNIAKASLTAMLVAGVVLRADAGTTITTPTTVSVSADVNNFINVAISNTDLGGFSVTGSTTDTATASFSPAGTPTDDPGSGVGTGQPASFVWDKVTPPQTPTVALSAGFHNATIIITYSNVVNLTCGGGSIIRITHITDDLATPTVWDKPGGGAPTSTSGQDTLNGAGDKTFHIGMTLATSLAHTYSSGACSGSFDFTVEY